ncbi:hypothetical protein SAMN05421837_107128 [Amycolatopsis pretoriensis]|uniref:Uncharacterized protein n=1 Tax=Amycolatopsis pretoriensis TaxID=218821 RepID=A0A1H5R6L8_9PSEU|nr:hypothetical protein [Amycolatopsis pretoriensis]SEF33959.1 hypothetical protein SAMN05421837_107128 [Amycolatopsis pretoriensis]
MDFTKIVAVADVIDNVPLLAAALFAIGQLLRPEGLRQRRRNKVVRQIQRSAKKAGEFTESQGRLRCALLEVPITDDPGTSVPDGGPPEAPPPRKWRGWTRRR